MRFIGKRQCLWKDPAIETSEDFDLSRLHLSSNRYDGEPLLWSREWKIEVGVHIFYNYLILWNLTSLKERYDISFHFQYFRSWKVMADNLIGRCVKTKLGIIFHAKFKSSQLSLLHMVNVWSILTINYCLPCGLTTTCLEFVKDFMKQNKAGSFYLCGCLGIEKSFSMEKVRLQVEHWPNR